MPDDDPGDDLFDDAPEQPSASPVPQNSERVPTSRVVYCTQCGVQLDGLRIGQACPNCGVAVGSTRQGANKASSGKAVAALVLGICSIVGCLFYGLPGLVCGALAIYFAWASKRDVMAGNAPAESLNMANSGKICGIIGLSLGGLTVMLTIGYIIFMFVFLMPQAMQQNNPANNPPFQTQPSTQPTTIPGNPPFNSPGPADQLAPVDESEPAGQPDPQNP